MSTTRRGGSLCFSEIRICIEGRFLATSALGINQVSICKTVEVQFGNGIGIFIGRSDFGF